MIGQVWASLVNVSALLPAAQVPYLSAFILVLVILTLSLAWAALNAHRRVRVGGDDDDDESPHSVLGMMKSALPPPKMLVRESSTLFRRVAEPADEARPTRLLDDSSERSDSGQPLTDLEEVSRDARTGPLLP